jgi:predicted ATPase with chaperone activity
METAITTNLPPEQHRTTAVADDSGHVRRAPRPRRAAETGLSNNLLESLLAKHLYETGVADLQQLVERLCLIGPVLEEVLQNLRAAALVEVRGVIESRGNSLRYALTDKGRIFALDALGKSGYIGPAPVPLPLYTRVVREQSVHHLRLTREIMHERFSEVTIRPELLDRLGAAMHSGRAIFLHGPPGAGKTYIARRLAWALGAPVLVPYALAVGDSIVQIFDPVIHRPLADRSVPEYLLEQGHDPRFVPCHRPAVVTGGELTLDMLEVRHEPATRLQLAPLQVKAANGIYVMDDLGRQRVSPPELFNRWIVPLESGEDHLTLSNGKRFPVPFDVVLVFSTNLEPRDLADDAFLRRIGHKIAFGPLTRAEYSAIWRQVCAERGITFDPEVLCYVLDELHNRSEIPLLACHPRDLLGLALDHIRYFGEGDTVSTNQIDAAWRSYFV